jgi:sporulation protein YlmC with PRC-barrel domain
MSNRVNIVIERGYELRQIFNWMPAIKYPRKEITMDIPIHATVSCKEVTCGESIAVIIDPTKEKITHIVVKEKNFPHVERIVPVNLIEASTSDSIQLKCEENVFAKMDEFIEHHFVRSDTPYFEYLPTEYLVWPYVRPAEVDYRDVQSEHIPPGELAIHRGAQVKSTDGRVGSVDEFLIDPANGHVTHLILREGHLWGKKEVTIPIALVDHISDNTVQLKLDNSSIEALPSIPVKRWF